LQLAGRSADGVILGTGFDLRVYDWAKQKIREARRRTGPESEINVIAAGMLCVDDDGAKSRKIVRNRLANRAHHNFRFSYETVPPEELEGIKIHGRLRRHEADGGPRRPDLVNDYLIHRFSIAGTPKECIARIEQLKATGVEHLMLTPARTVYNETVEAFAKNVIPHFRVIGYS
jgi:5,10-methylenetetrahydromethanopterin reductase